jgi:hypothetical protein
MATERPSSEPGKDAVPDEPRTDDWVAKIVDDPMDVPHVVHIFGFVGECSKQDHLRIYLTPSLTYLCEIPRNAIVHHEPVPRDRFPLGGSYFWVAADAWARTAIYGVSPRPASGSVPART